MASPIWFTVIKKTRLAPVFSMACSWLFGCTKIQIQGRLKVLVYGKSNITAMSLWVDWKMELVSRHVRCVPNRSHTKVQSKMELVSLRAHLCKSHISTEFPIYWPSLRGDWYRSSGHFIQKRPLSRVRTCARITQW
jgi:hypothetical protein